MNVSSYSKLLKWNQRNGSEFDGLLTPEEFEKTLANERERSNRLEKPFTILVLNMNLESDNPNYFDSVIKMVKQIQNRIRSIDSVARMNGQQIGVILPHTDYHGASSLAKEIQSQPFFSQLDLSIEIVEYPTNL